MWLHKYPCVQTHTKLRHVRARCDLHIKRAKQTADCVNGKKLTFHLTKIYLHFIAPTIALKILHFQADRRFVSFVMLIFLYVHFDTCLSNFRLQNAINKLIFDFIYILYVCAF